jgi:hypothetical protein
MKPTNMPSGAQRNADVGLVWIEILTNAQGTFELPFQGTFRVRATGATTVTIGGVLAMTMSTDEIAIFNVGVGPSDGLSYTSVTIAGANAFVQMAQDIEKGRNRR